MLKKIPLLLIFNFFLTFNLFAQSDFDYLYSASFKFEKGRPFIRVLAKTFDDLSIKNANFIVCNGRKIALKNFSVSIFDFQNKKVLYKISLQEIARENLKNYTSIKQKWEKILKLKTNIQVRGAVFSINGKKIDNRDYFIVLNQKFLLKSNANKKLLLLRKKFPDKNFTIIPILQKSTSSLLAIKSEKSSFVCKNIVEIKTSNKTLFNNDIFNVNGGFFITPFDQKNLALMIETDISELLYRILPGEMFLSAPIETLKAQAVAARTDIFMQLGKRHTTDPWHICSEVHCQKILWGKKINKKFKDAVNQTRGEVLLYKNLYVVRAPYSASSGGHTEDIRNVWFTAKKAYLQGIWDGEKKLNLDLRKESDVKKFLKMDYGLDRTKFNKRQKWKVVFSDEKMNQMLKKFAIGKIKEIIPLKRGVSGRIYKIKFVGEKEKIVYGELVLRRLLNNLYSSLFVVSHKDNNWIFEGKGWGHGVGMCQIGAITLGKQGKTYKYILKKYYPQTKIFKLY